MATNTLVDLCTRLCIETAGKTNEESFTILQQLVGNDIRVRYEIIRDENAQPDDDNKQVSASRFAFLNNLRIGRVLLTSNRLKADFDRELTRACNGVVFEYPSWRVLSVPTPMFNPRFRATDVSENMNSYSIYKIKDGTTVTMYYYNDQWCLSSTNGFDVSGYQWMGPSTYMQALTQVSANYPEFSFDKLDRSRAYTIGFRHNEFHPLKNDAPKMWLIQSCDLNAINSENPQLNFEYDTDIGIPAQNAEEFDISGKKLLKFLQDTNTGALGRYINSVRDPANTPDIHYGYVLRGNINGSDASVSNIILESDLLKTIRKLMYNLPKRRFNESVPITALNRLEYTILRAYLSCNTKYMFLNLFPQFSENYRKYDRLFNKLSDRILNSLRNRNTRESIANSIKTPKDGMNQRIDKLAFALVNHIEKCGRINAMDSQGHNIVLDFIMDREHLDLYFTCLFSA